MILTHNGELGARDVGSTHHPVVALVGHLAPPDLEDVAVPTDADVVLVAAVKFLGALVPGQSDLWVVDGDLTLEFCLLASKDGLVGNITQHGYGLWETEVEFLCTV